MQDIFKWKEEYLIGEKEIDAQHKMLFYMAKDILNLIQPNKDSEELKTAIQTLLEYIDMHFKAEEAYMMECDYPEIKKHKELHLEIKNSIKELLEKKDKLEIMNEELAVLMKKWIFTHIQEEDLKIGLFSRKK